MMRLKTIALLGVGLLLAGCNHTNKPKVLDRGAMLYVNVKDNAPRAVEEATEEKLYTPKEIVEFSQNFCLDYANGEHVNVLLGIGDEMKDVANERIKMWGEQIISEDGELVDYFMTAKNVRVCSGIYPDKDNFRNIMAYIPNKVMKEGWVKIQKAYKDGNYDEVYRLFQEVYTAIPITPSEYAKLREKGEN